MHEPERLTNHARGEPVPGQAASGIQFVEPPIFELGAPGRHGASIAELDVPAVDPKAALGVLARQEPAALPEVSEPEAFRHFVRLSQWNYSIDTQFYPLGSCTMKFNPKVNEWAARLNGFAGLHPQTPERLAQGALEIMVRLQDILAEIAGMDCVSLQPAAGAQGELTGLMMIRAYHTAQGRSPRKVFIPDSAHGTNPASCALNGFETQAFPAGSAGIVEPEVLARALEDAGDEVASHPGEAADGEVRRSRSGRRADLGSRRGVQQGHGLHRGWRRDARCRLRRYADLAARGGCRRSARS